MNDIDAEDELLFGMTGDEWKAAAIIAGVLVWSFFIYTIDWLVWWARGAL